MNILGEEVYNSIYDFSKINSRDKYSMFIRGNNALTIINNKNLKNGKKILVIKDSFANSLVPFLILKLVTIWKKMILIIF